MVKTKNALKNKRQLLYYNCDARGEPKPGVTYYGLGKTTNDGKHAIMRDTTTNREFNVVIESNSSISQRVSQAAREARTPGRKKVGDGLAAASAKAKRISKMATSLVHTLEKTQKAHDEDSKSSIESDDSTTSNFDSDSEDKEATLAAANAARRKQDKQRKKSDFRRSVETAKRKREEEDKDWSPPAKRKKDEKKWKAKCIEKMEEYNRRHKYWGFILGLYNSCSESDFSEDIFDRICIQIKYFTKLDALELRKGWGKVEPPLWNDFPALKDFENACRDWVKKVEKFVKKRKPPPAIHDAEVGAFSDDEFE